MRLKDLYRFFVCEGIKADLRKRSQVEKCLSDKRREYNKLTPSCKKFFDKESLSNPYSDTRILHGDPNIEIKTILVGIDIDVGEVLLADNLSKSGKKVDLVLSHHPNGPAYAGLDDVMRLQSDILFNLGIDKEVAADLIKKRMEEVGRRIHGANHAQVVDAARLLSVPLMCCHTPADNHVASYLQKLVDAKKPKTLKDLARLLLREKEYQLAAHEKAGPKVVVGNPEDKAGRIFVDMTGGTSGSKNVFPRLSQIGIKTQLVMHLSESHFDKIKSEYMHTVVAGHIASDSLGMNLLIDKLEKKCKVEILECSGFRRVKRR